MEKILIFAGTKEGRLLAEHLCNCRKEVHISVATAYGREVLAPREGLIVHQGRLGQEQMEQLLAQTKWEAVIDATHPYATEVSVLLRAACEKTGRRYLRLLREEKAGYDLWQEAGRGQPEASASFAAQRSDAAVPRAERSICYVDTKEEAAAWLNERSGNILMTTGSKELQSFLEQIHDRSRLYVRILPDGETVTRLKEWGLKGGQIICMQGPFSAELNEAMIRQLNIRYLVTKETGVTGGFPQKLAGAQAAGAEVVVLRRPGEADGYSMEELLRVLKLPPFDLDAKPQAEKPARQITLLGIGMGARGNLTEEARRACEQADLIVGAGRMLKTLSFFGKPMQELYRPEEILAFLQQNPQYQSIVAAFSGDVGFYSGAGQLLARLAKEDYESELLCGISSVAYAAARFGLSWQDMKLVSVHGRSQNVVGALRTHAKVFVLAGKDDSIRALARTLIDYGFPQAVMHVGTCLSEPTETLLSGQPGEFLEFAQEGLSVAILENQAAERAAVTHGLPDACFLRGAAPMTKEEVRSIALSKLALTRQAVVYDIGAGTGSIGIECALAAPEGMVYAIEKKEEAQKLLLENQRRLRAFNLTPIAGSAPEALQKLPAPTHAFIGGSSGSMDTIIALLLEKNPKVRIVISAIALETVSEVMRILQKNRFAQQEVVQVSVARAKALGSYHMMMGQNPVYLFTLSNECSEAAV